MKSDAVCDAANIFVQGCKNHHHWGLEVTKGFRFKTVREQVLG